jgi:hypothetical protein
MGTTDPGASRIEPESAIQNPLISDWFFKSPPSSLFDGPIARNKWTFWFAALDKRKK